MKETMWIIVDENGRFVPSTLRETKRDCIKSSLWSYWYKQGYRCKKVTVQINLTDKN